MNGIRLLCIGPSRPIWKLNLNCVNGNVTLSTIKYVSVNVSGILYIQVKTVYPNQWIHIWSNSGCIHCLNSSNDESNCLVSIKDTFRFMHAARAAAPGDTTLQWIGFLCVWEVSCNWCDKCIAVDGYNECSQYDWYHIKSICVSLMRYSLLNHSCVIYGMW